MLAGMGMSSTWFGFLISASPPLSIYLSRRPPLVLRGLPVRGNRTVYQSLSDSEEDSWPLLPAQSLGRRLATCRCTVLDNWPRYPYESLPFSMPQVRFGTRSHQDGHGNSCIFMSGLRGKSSDGEFDSRPCLRRCPNHFACRFTLCRSPRCRPPVRGAASVGSCVAACDVRNRIFCSSQACSE